VSDQIERFRDQRVLLLGGQRCHDVHPQCVSDALQEKESEECGLILEGHISIVTDLDRATSQPTPDKWVDDYRKARDAQRKNWARDGCSDLARALWAA
jgi:hypothetical protein